MTIRKISIRAIKTLINLCAPHVHQRRLLKIKPHKGAQSRYEYLSILKLKKRAVLPCRSTMQIYVSVNISNLVKYCYAGNFTDAELTFRTL